jgi:hypothetical protein
MNQATTVTQTTSAFEVAGGFDFSTSGGTGMTLMAQHKLMLVGKGD